jgi:acetolactate synthase I/III small subunit
MNPAPIETMTPMQAAGERQLVTIELDVRNHPGVMMHIVSLFARRAFNLEGIACFPRRDATRSQVWLRVYEDSHLVQVMRQLEKLVDVQQVRLHPASHEAFLKMEAFFRDEGLSRESIPGIRQQEDS